MDRKKERKKKEEKSKENSITQIEGIPQKKGLTCVQRSEPEIDT